MKHGPNILPITNSSDSETIACATTSVVYSKSFNLKYGEFFALWYQATSDGTVTLAVELEQGTALPTTEGAADTAWAVPSGVTVDATLSDETAHIIALSPVAMPFARLKITGSGSNAASTTLAAKLSKQEDF